MDRLQRLSFRRSRSNTDVGRFHSHVEDITKILDELSSVVEAVKRKQNDILGIPPLLNDNRKQELNDLHARAKFLSSKVKVKLEHISRKIKDFEKPPPCSNLRDNVLGQNCDSSELQVVSFSSWSAESPEPSLSKSNHVPAIQRVRKTHYSILLKRYVDLMAEYSQVQIEHRQRIKHRLVRQMEIMNQSYTEEELEIIIEEGSISAFTKSILTDTEMARQNLEDITERQKDILNLEKSIRELNELFKELAWLVEHQGALIDNIAINIASTADYVEKGRDHTKKASKLKAWTTKKKAILYTMGSSATVVTLVVVLVSCLL